MGRGRGMGVGLEGGRAGAASKIFQTVSVRVLRTTRGVTVSISAFLACHQC